MGIFSLWATARRFSFRRREISLCRRVTSGIEARAKFRQNDFRTSYDGSSRCHNPVRNPGFIGLPEREAGMGREGAANANGHGRRRRATARYAAIGEHTHEREEASGVVRVRPFELGGSRRRELQRLSIALLPAAFLDEGLVQ
jgi:hypothetical protein